VSAFDRYFHGPYRGVRAYVFAKVFLATVALDTWMLMIGHAGRYGVAGFNVAHFAWMDRVMPLPTPGLYVAVLLCTGLLALSMALLGSSPWAHAALFLLYTYSWSMSMLDSYQHHYFVSLILLCMIFFPRVSIGALAAPAADSGKADWAYIALCLAAIALYATVDRQPGLVFGVAAGAIIVATLLHARRAERRGRPTALVSGFGFNLLGASVAVLYTFTSIAKMDPEWCQGYTLQRISTAGRTFAPLVSVAESLGMRSETFWSLISTSVIPVELLIACGYALSTLHDQTSSRWLRRFVHLTFWLALSLHVGAEILSLDIGWFSYYMILLACCFLLPGPAIESLSLLITRPARLVARQLTDSFAPDKSNPTETVLVVLGVCAVLFAASFLIDLPGSRAMALLGSAALIALLIVALRRKTTAELRRIGLGVGCAATLMWAAIALSDVRWDFYRYLGGDLHRRGQLQAALEAYEKGEHYAPKGGSRRDKIEQIRKRLGR
jgi:hypothetical protein